MFCSCCIAGNFGGYLFSLFLRNGAKPLPYRFITNEPYLIGCISESACAWLCTCTAPTLKNISLKPRIDLHRFLQDVRVEWYFSESLKASNIFVRSFDHIKGKWTKVELYSTSQPPFYRKSWICENCYTQKFEFLL